MGRTIQYFHEARSRHGAFATGERDTHASLSINEDAINGFEVVILPSFVNRQRRLSRWRFILLILRHQRICATLGGGETPYYEDLERGTGLTSCMRQTMWLRGANKLMGLPRVGIPYWSSSRTEMESGGYHVETCSCKFMVLLPPAATQPLGQ